MFNAGVGKIIKPATLECVSTDTKRTVPRYLSMYDKYLPQYLGKQSKYLHIVSQCKHIVNFIKTKNNK